MFDHDHHSHEHESGRSLSRALFITLGFAVVEVVGGWMAHSLALLSDAAHMVTDSSALGLAVLAAWFARQPADREHTWGHGRAEALAALANALLTLVLVIGIAWEAVQRLRSPVPVEGGVVLVIAAIGLVFNLWVLRTLSHGHQTLNTRGAVLHVMGDALGSVAALVSGGVILWTGWTPIDPILSLLICVLVSVSGVRLFNESLNVVMEGVPGHLDLEEIGRSMAATPGVASVHDLHIWQVRSDQIALSAHVVVRDMVDWIPVLSRLNKMLGESHGIQHVTLQPEPIPEVALPHPKATASRPSA